ncbi:Acetyl esterase/lipase [Agreia bicolorata]|uniref:Acetyl esterase/lipase n=1 Tax=Agreia bicolorata TaxID=110935 RepID=A0A1T4WTJ9_9MICO|nr:alpha/beta hydrolase fold domain-containing protein [Agreia bicolorata]KJC64233.1 alpha/beta hydrolase [Agreia bicolorata]SKA80185.1 Acetyl esterase/lipase [Agreia bicolorata]
MPFEIHPDLAPMFAAMAGDTPPPPVGRGDVSTLRALGEGGLAMVRENQPEYPEVNRRKVVIRSFDGAEIAGRWYSAADDSAPGSAVVYLHGGGMVLGSVELFDRTVAGYVADSGVPMLAVDYRTAPENPHPTPVEDSYAGLVWLREQAAVLGVDADRIGVMGDSGGGGLAAAVAILARERGVTLARQILIYPMLDDRNTVPDPHLVPFAGWTYDSNYTGWHALLGDSIGSRDVPSSAAPARETHFAGLADAYIEVGELDIFRDEDVEYARGLSRAGVSTELHVIPGCPHGFDVLTASTPVVQRSRADRVRVLRSL